MEMIDYLRMLLRRWKWVVAFALVGWILGALWATVTPRVYEASATLFVGLNDNSQDRDDLSASRFTLERMDSYAELVDSPEVTQAVKDELRLDAEPQDIGGAVSADVLGDTVVMDVTATAETPGLAASIANVGAARLGDVIERVEAPATGGVSPVKVTVTRPANAPGQPIAPNTRLALALGLLAGIALGLLAAALRDQAVTNRALAGPSGRQTPVAGDGRPDVLRRAGDAEVVEPRAAVGREGVPAGSTQSGRRHFSPRGRTSPEPLVDDDSTAVTVPGRP